LNYLETRPWYKKTSSFPSALVVWLADTLPVGLLGVQVKNRTMRVADWGAGTGDFTKELRILSDSTYVYAFDGESAPAMSADNYTIVDFCNTELMSVVTKDFKGLFDFALCRNVLEHLENPTPLLTTVHDTLTKDGLFVAMVPDWQTYAPIFYRDYTHRRPYDKLGLMDLLRAHDFDIVESHEIMQYPPALKYPKVRTLGDILNLFLPVRWSEWLYEKTGSEFIRWATLRTVVVLARPKK
jgi:SAM-dependent methyltransferase